jgi:hypothetical protein
MTGYLFVSDEPRHGERVADEMPFTSVVRNRPALEPRQPALITLDRERVDGIARMTRGGPVASYKSRVRLDPVFPLRCQLRWQQALAQVPTEARTEIEAVLLSNGGQLKDESFDALLVSIRQLCPDSAGEIDTVVMLSRSREPLPVADEGEPIAMYEGDAIALALTFSGFDRREELSEWTGSADAPFLRGIPNFALPEDRVIEHDARVFGDWHVISQSAVGTVEFVRNGDRLTVINVNRAPIERALGVDLIYYTHRFDAYVLVQYKRMTRETGRDAIYRPDEQLERELARMRTLALDQDAPQEPKHDRLDEHCCYLKLCPPVARDLPVGDLVKGIYLPLAYWDLIAVSPEARGVRGGLGVTHDNVGRYLNNSQFVDLVQDAWVGSRGITSSRIEEVIRNGLDAERSIVLAIATPDPNRLRRRRR